MHHNTSRFHEQMHIPSLRKSKEKRTEHGHVLLPMEVPVTPVGSVAMQGGVLLVVVRGLRAEGVNHSDVAPGMK